MWLGPIPADEEDCAQVGDVDYYDRATAQCDRYIELIRKVVGKEPPGAYLKKKWSEHDLGSYVEVVCYFDTDTKQYPEAMEYAFECENDGPTEWLTDLKAWKEGR